MSKNLLKRVRNPAHKRKSRFWGPTIAPCTKKDSKGVLRRWTPQSIFHHHKTPMFLFLAGASNDLPSSCKFTAWRSWSNPYVLDGVHISGGPYTLFPGALACPDVRWFCYLMNCECPQFLFRIDSCMYVCMYVWMCESKIGYGSLRGDPYYGSGVLT